MTPIRAKQWARALLLTSLVWSIPEAGCGDNLYVICMPTSDAGASGAVGTVGLNDDAGVTPRPSGDASGPATDERPAPCPPASARRPEVVTGEIRTDTHWTCEASYLLGGYVTVKDGATLTIDPGTVIRGDATSALVITREGRIDARGTRDQPIVFTSVAPPGSRAAGGWQGVVLLGKARINVDSGEREFEGLPVSDPAYRYGGSDDTHDCGALMYVRIEFAGRELQPNQELNSLSLAACGSKTKVEYVQTHIGKDDGIELFGGTVSLKHIVTTGADDDSIDWDEGYRGRIQFAAIRQHDLTGAGDSNAIEASNRLGVAAATPVASPLVYNVTMIGDRDSYNVVRALALKDGTHGELRNIVAIGFASAAIDVASEESVAALSASPPGLSIANSLFYEIGPDAISFFPTPDAGESAADGNFDEAAFFSRPEHALSFGVDPQLPSAYDTAAPGWVPPADSPAAAGGTVPPDDGFFDTSAAYLGAFVPGGDDWTAGWTDYPEN